MQPDILAYRVPYPTARFRDPVSYSHPLRRSFLETNTDTSTNIDTDIHVDTIQSEKRV